MNLVGDREHTVDSAGGGGEVGIGQRHVGPVAHHHSDAEAARNRQSDERQCQRDQLDEPTQYIDGEPAAGGWDPVPVTLPTYVAKATAGRTVRTIDLDSTGVWSSGRNAADSALAREADEQRADQAEPEQRRVSGA